MVNKYSMILGNLGNTCDRFWIFLLNPLLNLIINWCYNLKYDFFS